MPDPVLTLDLGGSKILAALVDGERVLAEATRPTLPEEGPDAWLATAAETAAPWAGRFDRVAAAVTGIVDGGRWSALNLGTLPIPDRFPLVDRLAALLGRPALALNDAQAAAWGEHRFGAGQGEDMAFVTVSTGIGGGLVLGGKLRQGRGGLAGHLGVAAPLPEAEGVAHVEDAVAGRWVATEAGRAGHAGTAREVFEAAERGEPWATVIVEEQARRVARLLANLQLLVAPNVIVVGGGIGLAPGHLDRVERALAILPPIRRPVLRAAALGAHAGILGAADLARSLEVSAAATLPLPDPVPQRSHA